MSRLPPKTRKSLIEESALIVGKKLGYRAVSRHDIAKEAGVSSGLIPVYLGDAESMRLQILHAGCKEGFVKLILEGVIFKDNVAKKAAKEYKDEIIDFIFN